MPAPSIPNPTADPNDRYPAIDYSSRDFPTVKQALIEFIKARFPATFTDFTESNLSVMLLEVCAWVADMLSFTIDMAANECYLPTLRQRENAVNLVKLIGYEPSPPAAASAELLVDTNIVGGLAQDATISAGASISVQGLTFELLEDFVLLAGNRDAGPGSTTGLPGPTFAEGVSYDESFTVPASTPNQIYTLGNYPVIRGSVEVRVNGSLWNEVEALVFAGQANSYALDFDGDNRPTIRFGDGVSGNIPLAGSLIEVYSRVGGGEAGNIGAGLISTQLSATTISGTVQLAATNPNPASGGAEEESLDSIKFNAPRYVRTHGNAISKLDYDTLIPIFVDPTYGAIAKGVAFPRVGKTNSSANEIDVFVWTRTAGALVGGASQGLKEALLDYLNIRKVLNLDIFINDGLLKDIDMVVTLFVDQRVKLADEIVADVETALQDFFDRDSLEPAQTFFVSEVYYLLMGLAGVQQVNLGVPGTEDTASDSVDGFFIAGLTTEVTLTAGGLVPNAYAGGRIVYTSGALNGRQFPILRNTASVVTVDGINSLLAPGDTFDLFSLYDPLNDIAVADNEIYRLGSYTVAAYERSQDTRESFLITYV